MSSVNHDSWYAELPCAVSLVVTGGCRQPVRVTVAGCTSPTALMIERELERVKSYMNRNKL